METLSSPTTLEESSPWEISSSSAASSSPVGPSPMSTLPSTPASPSPSDSSSVPIDPPTSSCQTRSSFPPSCCQFCGSPRVSLVRTASRLKSCRDCFISSFENDVLSFIRHHGLFSPGQRVAVCVSGGKDSAVLLHVLHTLNERENLGLSLHLLAVDEGIKGYRDHALATVKRNSEVYNLPLHIVSYDSLYQGWTMDRIAKMAAAGHADPEGEPRSEYRKREQDEDISTSPQSLFIERTQAISSSSCSFLTCHCSGSSSTSCSTSASLFVNSSSSPSSVLSPPQAQEQGEMMNGGKRSLGGHQNTDVPVDAEETAARDCQGNKEEKDEQTPSGQSGGFTHSCTFCGIFRRQAFERGAQDIQADVLCTGHNADDGAETVLMNLLRGDTQRLPASAAAITGSKDGVGTVRVKPLLASFQREVVLYAHFNRLDYFATECTYSGAAYRGLVRGLLCALQGAQQQQRIVDLLHAAQSWIPPPTKNGEQKETVDSCQAERDSHEVLPEDAGSSERCKVSAPSSVDMPHVQPTTVGADGREKRTRESRVASIEDTSRRVAFAGKNHSRTGLPEGDTSREGQKSESDPALGITTRNIPPGVSNLRQCVSCGSWTKNRFCRACDLVNALNENKLQFVGMNSRQRQKLMEARGEPRSTGKSEGARKQTSGNGGRSVSRGSLAW